MTYTPVRAVLFAAAGAAVLAIALRASPAAVTRQGADASGLPDTPETARFVRVCGHCHDLQRIESHRRTRSEWSDTIRQMVDDGAEGSDEDFDAVLDFLLRHFGAVAINRAAATDLVTVLDISTADADAIVAYRTAKGTFADFDAIRKVPGIDIAKLEQRKDAIRF